MNATNTIDRTGRMSRLGSLDEPAGYVDGSNLFEFVRGNPVTERDPSRLITIPEGYADTSVSVCIGYLKGDPIFGNVPAHSFIMVGGAGYGFYANSHAGGPPDSSGGVGVIATKGRVVAGDEGKYPPTTNPKSVPNGMTYSICSRVVVKTCVIDPDRFSTAVKNFVASELGKQQFYGAGIKDCADWVNKAIGVGVDGGRVADGMVSIPPLGLFPGEPVLYLREDGN